MDSIAQEQVGSWKAVDQGQFYDREGIFTYIDGAGEVYRLYGFKGVLVRAYRPSAHQKQSRTLKVEVFDMGRPADAFGIFSHSRPDASIAKAGSIGQGSYQHEGLVCFWKHRYFVCVSSPDVGVTVAELAGVAERLSTNIPKSGAPPAMLGILPKEGVQPDSIKFFHRYEALTMHYFIANRNILGLSDRTDAVLARYDSGARLLCVAYHQTAEAARGLEQFLAAYLPESSAGSPIRIKGGKWVGATQVDSIVIIVFDAPSERQIQQLLKNTIALTAKLGKGVTP